MEDRRRGARHHVYLAAEIYVEDAHVRTAITKDVSSQGMLVLTRARLTEGQSVKLRVYLPGEEDRVEVVEGTVVRREPLAPDERGTWSEKVAVAFGQPRDTLAHEFSELATEQARIYGWERTD
ncbi:MAG: PilZ domain-containing protein [Polyangiaceae bacterium]|nr:PilZ domain-containing protein [Polyangiaceae bacterium]